MDPIGVAEESPAHRQLTPDKSTNLLKMRHVEKSFNGDVVALRDMNMDVEQGEFVSLLGPSGCGKSTALRLIAGLARPTSGSIAWEGGQNAGDLGVVFQEPTLMPWAGVKENVWLPLRLRGVSFKECRDDVARALELVGLDKFQDAYPRELSGGMKMRVSIARAMVTKPRLILMDEPFAALDEITRQKMNSDLLTLRDTIGCTVIFVTHSVYESVFLSDRIVIMAARPGRVIREVDVDFKGPRTDKFRTSVEFLDYARRASDALQQAMVSV